MNHARHGVLSVLLQALLSLLEPTDSKEDRGPLGGYLKARRPGRTNAAPVLF
jgi:hypothetical protein